MSGLRCPCCRLCWRWASGVVATSASSSSTEQWLRSAERRPTAATVSQHTNTTTATTALTPRTATSMSLLPRLLHRSCNHSPPVLNIRRCRVCVCHACWCRCVLCAVLCVSAGWRDRVLPSLQLRGAEPHHHSRAYARMTATHYRSHSRPASLCSRPAATSLTLALVLQNSSSDGHAAHGGGAAVCACAMWLCGGAQ